MNAYIYQAALLCNDCGKAKSDELAPAIVAAHPEFDYFDESSYDSAHFPKGPYPDGGGESDSCQYCDSCGEFLENPLTADGYASLLEMAEGLIVDLATGKRNHKHLAPAIAKSHIRMLDFYRYDFGRDERPIIDLAVTILRKIKLANDNG